MCIKKEMEDPPSDVETGPTMDGLASLHRQCDAIVGTEQVDKTVALGIVRLLHSAETMLLELRHAKDQEIERLRHDLAVVTMGRKYAEMVQSLSEDHATMQRQHEQLAATVQRLDTALREQLSAKRR